MKRTMFILSRIFIAGILLLTSVESTTITSVSYNAGTNILTFTFSDSVYTDNILLGRMTFDDDNGGPNPDVVFSGGTLLTAEPLSPELQISLIYGGIIDHWKSPDGKERDIWGNALTLVNAVESLDMSSLRLIIEEGTFINNIAEPFDDTDGNGVYSPSEQFTDINSNGIWDDAEEFSDLNGDGIWNPTEIFVDTNNNDIWDPPEEYTDADSNGIWNAAEGLFYDTNGNGIWDNEPFVDLNEDGEWTPAEYFIDFNNNDTWDPPDQYEDTNGNGTWDDHESFTDTNGNSTWDDAEEFSDLNGDSIWTPAEPLLIDHNMNSIWDSTEVLIVDRNGNGEWDAGDPVTDVFHFNGFWDPGEEFTDVNGNHIWDAAETFSDENGNEVWDPIEEFTDANGNGVWDPAEDFFDSPLNGVWDENTGETFEDINGNNEYDPPDVYYDANENGTWDRGDEYTDTNGNGFWDNSEPLTDIDGDGVWDDAESFTDANDNGLWDLAETLTLDNNNNGIWNDGEVLTDLNANGVWDPAEEFEDLNGNGIWDPTESLGDPNGNGYWDDGDGFNDNNNNDIWDGIENFNDLGFGFPPQGAGNGSWDFVDSNGNGVCDSQFGPNAECEPWTDVNNNGICDQETLTYDANGNGEYDPAEGFIDINGNGVWDNAESFIDADGDGTWYPGEEVADLNGNNMWDDEEPFTDSNGNNVYDEAEPIVDFDGDNEFDESSEEFIDTNGNSLWDQYESNLYTTLEIAVSGQDNYPVLISADYDANVNRFSLVFDRLVKFDQIPEDETFQNGPGNDNLDSGEDRNNNGALDYEANINIFKVGFQDGDGNVKMLEGMDQVIQTEDSETIDIILTKSDSKKLETSLDLSSLFVNLISGAFVDTLYNPTETSNISIELTEEELPLFADSASYNITENLLEVFFRTNEAEYRTLKTIPTPIYSKFKLSSSDTTISLGGIEGPPFIQSDRILQLELMLSDQKALETMIEGYEGSEPIILTVEEYAIYDANNNGNLTSSAIPLTILNPSSPEESQPPQVDDGLYYDSYDNFLFIPWNMNIGYFNDVEISTVSASKDQYKLLDGLSLYDSNNDSTLTLSLGEVGYIEDIKKIYIYLSETDAEKLENYKNRSALDLTLDPYTFYSAKPYNNGNEALTPDIDLRVHYRQDMSAPAVNSVLFDSADSTLTVTLNELVDVSLLYPSKFSFGGVEINGSINVADSVEFVSSFNVSVSGDVYDEIISLKLTNPNFEAVAGAFINIDGTTSDWIDMNAAYGRYFWTKSFEAFAPAPTRHFAALRASGNYCDIYVDTELWNSKVNAEDLGQIMTAFESSAPGDSTTGIAGLTQEFLGADIKDTDGNSKVIFVLTDILDEYGLGRNDALPSLFVHGYSTVLDTVENEPYSNSGDIIYLDADPMSLTSNDEDLSATYNAISHEYSRMIMQHNQPDQENWIIEGVSTILQKKTTGDVKFFGRSTSPSFTAGNQLTYIATGYQSLKGRSDKYNAYLFLSYLQEKYSTDGTGWDIIQAIAQSDSIGIKAVGDALVTMEIDTDVKDIFANYGMACYLDAAHVENLYNGNYNFEGFNLQKPPSDKSAALLSWNASIGKGAPYTKKDILPWSYNYLIMQGYSFDLAGNVNYLSPDLNADDELVFNGYDGISFKVKKLILKSSFLNQMNPDYEVVDIILNDNTGYGTLPVTTKDGFALKDTLDYAVDGVQLMVLMIAKTDDAQPPATYDFAVSNVVSLPDFSDLYAYQNPGIQNYLDVYVVSQRRVFDHLGNEGPVVNYSITPGDSGSVALTELTSYGSDLVIYHTSKALSTEGTYQFIYQGNDQSGNLFEVDSLTIVVDYYDPASASRIVAGSAEFNLQSESLENPLMIAAGTIPLDCTVSFPEGFAPVSEIMMFGPDDQKLKRSANVTFFFNETDQTMSIYQLHQGEWRHIGAEILENSLQARSNSLGQFVVLAGNHGELDKELVLPEQYTLHQNYPNPFNPVTHITFDIPDQGHVSLVIYDIMGREISRIFDGNLKSGQYTFIWKGEYRSGSKQGAGIYFYRLTTDDFQQTRKMLILK